MLRTHVEKVLAEPINSRVGLVKPSQGAGTVERAGLAILQLGTAHLEKEVVGPTWKLGNRW
jgi:hypothetical protein